MTKTVTRTLLLLCVALAASIAAWVPASAQALEVGVGEQGPEFIRSSTWQDLGFRDVRLVVSWNVMKIPWEVAEADRWLSIAQQAGARVLVSFSQSRVKPKGRVLPTKREYKKAFLAFRERYPNVTTFIPWNEANHARGTARRPEMAANYYNAIREACTRCTVVAADVLDTPNMLRWLKRFKAHAAGNPRLWGLHNYLDANRLRTSGTASLLKHVRGTIWFTETGGIVKRRKRSAVTFPESAKHAAAATRWVFRLARLSPRIRRVYFYHWQPATVNANWDSALFDRAGRPRPAFKILKAWATKDAKRKEAIGQIYP